ncbi:MAG TPA: D-glycero-beta-D-manno-heptose 1-phosphate adenylyltransferase [Gammaproteobacteria bacterium]|nr:D-glycero-beta-D-manno-heptose 1-phosphate adenylyltransferase [Gammaproteobacteria bacterium]
MDLSMLQSSRVAVVGDLILDRYWMGEVKRISPESPVPILSVEGKDDRLGGAANLALNLVGLGCKTHLLGCLGDDEVGDKIRSMCGVANIHLYDVLTTQPSTVKIRLVHESHQLVRADFETVLLSSYQEELLNKLAKVIDKIDVLVLSDYDKGVVCDPQKFIQLAKKKGVPVLVDPKNKHWSCYQGVDLIKPNLLEFKNVQSPEDPVDIKAKKAIKDYDIKSVVLTQGSQGMTWYTPQGSESYASSHVEVFDVTGAGDTVMSVLAATHPLRWTAQQRMSLASEAAAIVIQQMKTTSINIHQLIINNQEKIMTQDHVRRLADASRRLGYKIVVTNGCFDLLHPGHIRYLQEAKRSGDQLWVLVNSDASVKRLKGEKRPINNLNARMEMLSSLAFVDRIIPFDEETPESLIHSISPDILVKGGDYSEDEIAGAKGVRANGGRVLIIPTIKGYSSTKIIENCKK